MNQAEPQAGLHSNPKTPQPTRPTGPAHPAWHLVFGLTLWLIWFGATYGGLAVACAVAHPPPDPGVFNWLSATVLLLALAFTTGFGLASWWRARAARRVPAGTDHARERFIAFTAAALYATASLSTVVVALPALLLTPCA
jgi:hypothetical protein